MSTALESNSRVEDMTDFEILMHEDIKCDLESCTHSANWRGRFCRPCEISAIVCSEHKNEVESWIKRQIRVVCDVCGNHVDHKDITWTKI